MATVTVFATGDEIATYTSRSMTGNNDGVQLTLDGVQTLGSSTDVFRIEIRQINNGTDTFSNGQFVDIFAHPDTSDPPVPLVSNLNPQHDQFQGRASSGEHQVFTQPANIVFDINGITSGTIQYGPGFDPPRSEQLDFGAFSSDPPSFPCFAEGTLIETATGPLPIEILKIGDLVKTRDRGLQPIAWAGHARVDGSGNAAPVRIPAGALDNWRDLYVSPQHRILRTDTRAELYFGDAECLVAAKHLIGLNGITSSPRHAVTYHHILCPNHEVILSEGLPTETLHLGHMALDLLGPAARAEIAACAPDAAATQPTARPCLRHWETRVSLTHEAPIDPVPLRKTA